MNLEIVLHVLGRLSALLGWLLLVPVAACLGSGGLGSPTGVALLVTAGLALGGGWALRIACDWDPARFGPGEAFASFGAGWVLFATLGALPYLLTGTLPVPLDALFESLSGFTTTGATLFVDPAVLPPPLLLWRALTSWIGGFGFVAVSVAVLPALGAGGNFLYGAELPGRSGERLLPRLSTTVRWLWILYAGFTLAVFAGLVGAGLSTWMALCQSLALVSTGGFVTSAAGLSTAPAAVQWVASVAMLVAGLNFAFLLVAARGRVATAGRNSELRLYLLGFAALVAVFLWAGGTTSSAGLRGAILAAASSVSTTGLPLPADTWRVPILPVAVLLFAALGACSGSPGGGLKIARAALLAKGAFREVARLLRPASVLVLKVDGKPLPERVLAATGAILVAAMLVTAGGAVALAFMGLDQASATASAMAAAANLGGGAAAPGSSTSWADLPALGKLVVMALMLLGRLEFFSVLVLFSRHAWRR